MIQTVLQSIDSRRNVSLELLKDFLRIPSVSTKPDHAPHMRQCAEWLAAQLRDCNLSVSIEKTAGHPVVLARNDHKKGRPTVLFYGHYDVQPPEPLDLWTTPPFDPTVRKTDANTDAIYARGAVDDKGQVWAHVEAIRAWQKDGGGLPVNLVMLIEGEEEIGSTNLEEFIRDHADQLRADVAVISDTSQFSREIPAITYALRGIAYAELTLTGPSHDLHSGMFGGVAANPANALSALLASFVAKDGRVNLPGFYDDVREVSPAERSAWAKLPMVEADLAREIGQKGLPGEPGYSALERMWARPTFDINGLTSGYQGVGAKTVIPSVASAKFSMRLVPDQDPKKIWAALERAVNDRCPPNYRVNLHSHGLSPPILLPMQSESLARAANAVASGFGRKPVLIRGGGIIHVVAMLKTGLGIDTLLVGFGLSDDRAHSPNEKFELECLYKGMRTAAYLYEQLSRA